MNIKKYKYKIPFLIICCLLLEGIYSNNVWAGSRNILYQDKVIKIADFILDLQSKNGAVRDSADTETVNTDSNMEYALIGLGAAYRQTADRKYLEGLQKGISWLAKTECMSDKEWNGSWWYSYDVSGEHEVYTNGEDIKDIRGVDTTSALFIYLLYLDHKLEPSSSLAEKYKKNALAAANFLTCRNIDTDSLSWSSYQLNPDGKWDIYRCKYSSDQGDVYLGLRAAGELYDSDMLSQTAEKIKNSSEKTFFSSARGRYCMSIENSTADWSLDSFDPIQSQGFLAWVWGGDNSDQAVHWLSDKIRKDGAVSCYEGDPEYAMSIAVLGIGLNAAGSEPSSDSYKWLFSNLFDNRTGGIRDNKFSNEEDCNVAGFCIIALTSMLPFEQNMMYGITLNDITAASENEVIAAIDAMDHKPTVRVVMNPGVSAKAYAGILSELHKHAFIMLCPCDSSYFGYYPSSEQYVGRFRESVKWLSKYVDIWEVGNEINGEGWLGIDSDTASEYMYKAWKYLDNKGFVTELTPYDFRKGDQSVDMISWLKKYVPEDMKENLDHVLISYYDEDNEGVHDDWKTTFDALKKIFPNSYIGFGECGFDDPHVFDKEFEKQVNAYYGMPVYNDRYEGGYFWWYWQEDCVPYKENHSWKCINKAIAGK